jgi:hypothetical protein
MFVLRYLMDHGEAGSIYASLSCILAIEILLQASYSTAVMSAIRCTCERHRCTALAFQ